MATRATKPEWHLIDAQNRVLGRVATQAATLLMGKHHPTWSPHLAAPVYVVVTNTDRVVLTGQKESKKEYRWYTGHPRGLRRRPVHVQRASDSRRLITEAVAGMLPKNSLRKQWLLHLKVYRSSEHPHIAQVTKSK